MAARTCPYCGERNPVDAKICSNCGERLPRKKKKKKRGSKAGLIIALAVLGLALIAVVLYYLLVYRPATVPANVTNKETKITADGKEYSALYSGVMLNRAPYGEGNFVVQDENGTWDFVGVINRNGTISGAVSGMPMHITMGGTEYPLHYTGQVDNGMPTGEGYFDAGDWTFTGTIFNGVMNGQAAGLPVPVKLSNETTTILYSGEIEDNQLNGDVAVENEQIDVSFQDGKYTGAFTGVLKYGVPNGQGTFKSDGTPSLEYTGEWESGYISGSGQISGSNIMVYILGAQRHGAYSGGYVNGMAEGEGTFSGTDDEGNSFTYTGPFVGNMPMGQGRLQYDDPSKIQLVGNFENGKYYPTFEEMLETLGTSQNEPFTIPEESVRFVSENQLFFKRPTTKDVKKLITKKFDVKTFAENQSAFAGKMFRIKLKINGVTKLNDFYGYRLTIIDGEDAKGNPFKGYYFGTSLSAIESRIGKKINVVGYPAAYSQKEGSENGIVEYFFSYIG